MLVLVGEGILHLLVLSSGGFREQFADALTVLQL